MENIERIQCGIVNCYLLTGETGAVLIDACNAADGEAILARVQGAPVKLILLTHGHADHIGAAAFLREKLGAPIALHAADAELLARPNARKLHGHTPLGRILARASEKTLESAGVAPFAPDVLLAGDEDLSPYGVDARVLALPGHTAGSVGVRSGGGALFAGDAAFCMLRPTGARIYENRAQMERSVETIKRSGAARIYVGHGRPVRPEEL